jgi:hypothetical protein
MLYERERVGIQPDQPTDTWPEAFPGSKHAERDSLPWIHDLDLEPSAHG